MKWPAYCPLDAARGENSRNATRDQARRLGAVTEERDARPGSVHGARPALQQAVPFKRGLWRLSEAAHLADVLRAFV